LASFARRVASFASYIPALFGQNEIVAGSRDRSENRMTVDAPDRFKAANAFWIGLSKTGLTPVAVLSQARVPVTVDDGKKNLVTTAQFFALWRAVGELSSDPAAGKPIKWSITNAKGEFVCF
jgi:hypothetical protein